MSVIDTRHGIGVSPGIAVGPVVQVRPPVRPPEKEPVSADPAAAGKLIRKVLGIDEHLTGGAVDGQDCPDADGDRSGKLHNRGNAHLCGQDRGVAGGAA